MHMCGEDDCRVLYIGNYSLGNEILMQSSMYKRETGSTRERSKARCDIRDDKVERS